MMEAFEMFSKSTGLRVNPAKCCIFFDGVDQNLKDDIRLLTGFEEEIAFVILSKEVAAPQKRDICNNTLLDAVYVIPQTKEAWRVETD
ncbi:hypothetical protein KIW84_050593 [Lathyrus oleraceus]|uniref:Uncharacterized protein n=1 Tax=Pisum sativum TaxID=3888 RepID=A0A9D4WJW1_PEA|nr:hypothetical protein KIW84_050593 [Pisum sativum]